MIHNSKTYLYFLFPFLEAEAKLQTGVTRAGGAGRGHLTLDTLHQPTGPTVSLFNTVSREKRFLLWWS